MCNAAVTDEIPLQYKRNWSITCNLPESCLVVLCFFFIVWTILKKKLENRICFVLKRVSLKIVSLKTFLVLICMTNIYRCV